MKKGYANMQGEACFCKGKLAAKAFNARGSMEAKCRCCLVQSSLCAGSGWTDEAEWIRNRKRNPFSTAGNFGCRFFRSATVGSRASRHVLPRLRECLRAVPCSHNRERIQRGQLQP